MKASELIKRLQELVEGGNDGNIQLRYYDNYHNTWHQDNVALVEDDVYSKNIIIVTE